MDEWILIVMMLSPSGEFMDKYTKGPYTKVECIAKQKELPTNSVIGAKLKGICVTKDHWTGKKTMTNVALD
jgi:hypothetical protein